MGMPSEIAVPQVIERPAGYDASINFGAGAFLTIYRQEEPVSRGSLLDAEYRKSLLTSVDAANDVRSEGKLVSISGHDAWMIIDAHVPQLLQIHTAAPSNSDEMPRFVSGRFVSLYPAPSRRRGEQGAVDVEFSINGHGNVRDLKQIYAAHQGLAQEIPEYLAHGVFRVPPNWEQMGFDKRRFVMEFQFWVKSPGTTCPRTAGSPHVPGAMVVSICNALPSR